MLAAKLCGKAGAGGRGGCARRLGLGAAPRRPRPAARRRAGGGTHHPARSARRAPGGDTPTPTADATPPAGTKRACDDGLDNDGDGQTDWEDPGCSDAGDTTENSEVPASAECAASSGSAWATTRPGSAPGSTRAAGPSAGRGPGRARHRDLQRQQRLRVHGLRPDRERDAQGRRDRHGRRRPAAQGPGRLREAGDDRALPAQRRGRRAARSPSTTARRSRRPRRKCDNGKDDDGDGLVDSRDAAGTTEPDPGCGGVADTTENSEVPTPESCQVQVGFFGTDKTFTGLLTSGCGVLKGAWFRPPGTPKDCLWAFGDDDWAACGGADQGRTRSA